MDGWRKGGRDGVSARTYGCPVVSLCNVSCNEGSVVAYYLRVEEQQHTQSGWTTSTAPAIICRTSGRGGGGSRDGRRASDHLSVVGAAPAAEQGQHRGVVERRSSVIRQGRIRWKVSGGGLIVR